VGRGSQYFADIRLTDHRNALRLTGARLSAFRSGGSYIIHLALN
jgi:hypothetical protein